MDWYWWVAIAVVYVLGVVVTSALVTKYGEWEDGDYAAVIMWPIAWIILIAFGLGWCAWKVLELPIKAGRKLGGSI